MHDNYSALNGVPAAAGGGPSGGGRGGPAPPAGADPNPIREGLSRPIPFFERHAVNQSLALRSGPILVWLEATERRTPRVRRKTARASPGNREELPCSP
ncbi:hypothetical protein GCM10009600_37510 [Oerskovia paurometabola]